MPNNNNKRNNKGNRAATQKAVNRLSQQVKSMRVTPRRQSKAVSLGSLAGFLPASVNYKGATEIGVALGKKMQSTGPVLSTSRRHVYTVSNKELVLPEISGATTFTQQARIEINPGLPATFPWLSEVAKNYAEYKFRRLVFRYITRSPTTKSGSVMFVPLYDPLSTEPSTEQNASAIRGTLEGPVWEEMAVGVDRMVSNALNKYFIRDGPVSADLKTYDPIAVVVYTNDCDDTTAVGKLWVEYEVDFFEPVTSETQAPSARGISMFNWGGAGAQTLTNGSVKNYVYWASLGVTTVCNALKTTISGSSLIPPKGCYVIRYWLTLSDDTAESAVGVATFMTRNKDVPSLIPGNSWYGATIANNKIRFDGAGCFACSGSDLIDICVQIFTGSGTFKVLEGSVDLTICSA